jgi:16S rRNA (adenine1518-N6/adenine1519-N6)-dimethyltransferase
MSHRAGYNRHDVTSLRLVERGAVVAEGAVVRLLTPGDIRELAGRLEVRPSKRLGQNFVVEQGTVRRIAALAALRPEDVVLEVGPGLGSLTLALLEAGAGQVVGVEIDPVLAAELPRTVAARAPGLAGRLVVIGADALHVTGSDLTAVPSILVANLPYNVAVPVLLHLLVALPSLERGLVMVQAEVADRMCAPPGSRVYGAPSVKLAWFAAVRSAGPVPRSVFWPVPNVDSRLVAFTRRDPPDTTASREEVFAVVDAAFRQRRKTLRAALSGWAGSAPEAERLLRAAGLDPGARGEALDVAEFARLAATRKSAQQSAQKPAQQSARQPTPPAAPRTI